MAAIKLIAIDLDDTLLNGELKVSDRAVRAIKEARSLGVKVTIATGRMYKSALPYAKQLDIDVPLITYHGALVKNSLSEEVLVYQPVPLKLAREIFSSVGDRGYHVNAYINDQLFVNKITEEGLYYSRIANIPLNPVGDLADFFHEDPLKIVVIADPEEVANLKCELRETFKDVLHITTSKPTFLEILHPEATKAAALSHLAQIYEVKQEEIMAFGDSYNDLEMLEYAGFAVAMGNAYEDIKKVANYVGPTNEEDGVAKVIEQFILLQESI